MNRRSILIGLSLAPLAAATAIAAPRLFIPHPDAPLRNAYSIQNYGDKMRVRIDFTKDGHRISSTYGTIMPADRADINGLNECIRKLIAEKAAVGERVYLF